MNFITQTLNWISNGLMLPVMVLLLIALFGALIALGGFASTSMAILRERRNRKQSGGVFAKYSKTMAKMNWNMLECEKFIFDLRSNYEKELERAKFMTKIGPMLGLMGTLIPMGPALAGLASGDIASMAYNMQIAFATTVVGCFVAGVGLLIYSVKKHWYAEEITELSYILECQKESEL